MSRQIHKSLKHRTAVAAAAATTRPDMQTISDVITRLSPPSPPQRALSIRRIDFHALHKCVCIKCQLMQPRALARARARLSSAGARVHVSILRTDKPVTTEMSSTSTSSAAAAAAAAAPAVVDVCRCRRRPSNVRACAWTPIQPPQTTATATAIVAKANLAVQSMRQMRFRVSRDRGLLLLLLGLLRCFRIIGCGAQTSFWNRTYAHVHASLARTRATAFAPR